MSHSVNARGNENEINIPSIDIKGGFYYFSQLPMRYQLLNMDSSTKINISNGRFNDEGYIEFFGTSDFSTSKISFCKKINDSLLEISSQTFYTITLPITVQFDGKFPSQPIDFDNFKKGELTATLDNFDYNLKFTIESFTVITTVNDSIVKIKQKVDSLFYLENYLNEMSFFSKEFLDLSCQFGQNQIVIFDDLKINMSSNNEIMRLNPVVFIVTRNLIK